MVASALGCGRRDAAPASANEPAGAAMSRDTARSTPTPAKRPTVLFIGTSLTAGYGLDDPATQAYPAVVGHLADSAGTPITVSNAGVTGETSAGALARIDWVLRQPADVVVLETGANDALRGLSVRAAEGNLRAIVRRIQAAKPDVPVLLVPMEAPPNLGSTYVTAFRAMYPVIAKQTGAILTPFLLRNVAGLPSLNQADGIHPNVAGARILGATVWEALAPLVQH